MGNGRRALMAIVVVVLGCWPGAALPDPFPGGLPVCLEDLNICTGNLATCTATLNTRTADLASCTAKLSTSTASLATCTANEAACEGNLGTCTTNLSASTTSLATCTTKEAACEASLGTCTTNLSASTASLATCTTKETACEASLGTCTTNLSASTASLATCTAGLAASQTDLSTCTTNLNARTADLTTCTTSLTSCTADLGACTTDLGTCQSALASAQQFPETGQATCWNSSGGVVVCAGTGQDGAVRAGAPLSYTDNGDGTVTDNNTKLVWEKKSADGGIHDRDATYSWNDAFAVHVAALNAASFGGYSDWRLPNVRELQSIVDYERFNPSVSSAFNSNCNTGVTVLTGSCTTPDAHWVSTTTARSPAFAMVVIFNDGLVGEHFKVFERYVRAVRGGP
jgi:uncharacterized protein DUF1566